MKTLKTLTIEVPNELMELLGEDALKRDARQALVLQALRDRKISAGKAAELLSMDRWDFMQLMARYDIPSVEVTEEELDQELKTLSRLRAKEDE